MQHTVSGERLSDMQPADKFVWRNGYASDRGVVGEHVTWL